MALAVGNLLLPIAGIGLAASATTFAAVMISGSVGAPSLSGTDHLGIFGRPSSALGARNAGRKAAPPQGPADLDPVTVGSIKPRPPAPRPRTEAETQRAATPVRGLFDGRALVEVPSGFALVDTGSRQPQVGEVLSLETRNGKWVMVDAGD